MNEFPRIRDEFSRITNVIGQVRVSCEFVINSCKFVCLMCLAHPGKIISVKNDAAVVDFGGIRKEVNISLIKAKAGDYVNIHAGFAIQKLGAEDAMDVLKIYEEAKGHQETRPKDQ